MYKRRNLFCRALAHRKFGGEALLESAGAGQTDWQPLRYLDRRHLIVSTVGIEMQHEPELEHSEHGPST